MLRAMQRRFATVSGFGISLLVATAYFCSAGTCPRALAQDVAPAFDAPPEPGASKPSRRAQPAPAPEPPPPTPATPPPPTPATPPPTEPPEPETNIDPADPDAPPPAPQTPGDYAGNSDGLASDTAEETEAQFHEPEHREFSVRIDPLNWLLLGRLGIELEMGLWKFISIELIPIFVTSTEPLLLNYSRFDNTLTAESRGIGPISGASLGAGVWLMGEPFSGYVIRLNFTNYAYTYNAADGGGTFDRVEVTERRIALFFGSHSRFGPFTIAGGFGLGLELNQNERCALERTSTGDDAIRITGRTSNCEGRQLIALNRNLSETADLNGPLHPVYFEARFSFGVVF